MDTRQPLLFPSPPLAPLKKKKKKSSSNDEDDLPNGLATPRSSLEIFPSRMPASQKCAWHVNQVLSPFETDLEHIKPFELSTVDSFSWQFSKNIPPWKLLVHLPASFPILEIFCFIWIREKCMGRGGGEGEKLCRNVKWN